METSKKERNFPFCGVTPPQKTPLNKCAKNEELLGEVLGVLWAVTAPPLVGIEGIRCGRIVPEPRLVMVCFSAAASTTLQCVVANAPLCAWRSELGSSVGTGSRTQNPVLFARKIYVGRARGRTRPVSPQPLLLR